MVLGGFGGRIGLGCGDAGGDLVLYFFGGDAVSFGDLLDDRSGGDVFVHIDTPHS